MTFEIGAAQGWNKPIFAIVPDPEATRLSAALRRIESFTTGRVQDLIRAIKRIVGQVTDDDRALLTRLFAEMGMTLDQLADDSEPDGQSSPNVSRKGQVRPSPEERLLSELLRLRKQGRLRRNRSQPTTPST